MMNDEFQYKMTKSLAEKIGRELIKLGEKFDRRGWIQGGGGNFSAKLQDGKIIFTLSGVHKGELKLEDLAILDPTENTLTDVWGNSLDGDKKISSDSALHLKIYGLDRSAGAILHVHTISSMVVPMKLSRPGSYLVFRDFEILKSFPGVEGEDSEYFLPIFGKKGLLEELESWWKNYGGENGGFAFLLWRHGLFCWAEDLREAYRRLDALDYLLNIKQAAIQLNISSLL